MPAWVPAELEQLPSLTTAWPEGKAGVEINPLTSTLLLSRNAWDHSKTKVLATTDLTAQPGWPRMPSPLLSRRTEF